MGYQQLNSIYLNKLLDQTILDGNYMLYIKYMEQ